MPRFLLVVTVLAFLSACTPRPAPPVPTPSPSPQVTTPITSAPIPPPPPCARRVRACVSLSQRKAWLTENGRPVYGPVPIAHGGPANPTPTGTYPVSWKDEENTSSVYGTPMPYSVFFAPGGIAFHQGDTRTDSHGCVRLTMPAARAFFAALQPGELVQVLP